MADIKWLEITVNTTPDQLDQVSAKLTAAGMDGLVIEDEGDFLQFLEQNGNTGTMWTRSCGTG